METRTSTAIWLALLIVLTLARVGDRAFAATAESRVKPGEFVVDHPTLINLGFEWLIEGDDNRNARSKSRIASRARRQWKQGLPLLRLQGERIFQPGRPRTSSRRTCSPAAFWTWSPTPRTKRGS